MKRLLCLLIGVLVVGSALLGELPFSRTTAYAASGGKLSVSVKGASRSGGVYQVNYSESTDKFRISWTCSFKKATYSVKISGTGSSKTIDRGSSKSLSLTAGAYLNGTYKATVTATSSAGKTLSTTIRFRLVQQSSEPSLSPEETPSPGTSEEPSASESPSPVMPGGGGGGGGGRRGGGGGTQEEQGFTVTPGTALIASHSDGDESMKIFGTVGLTPAEGEMTTLMMDGEELNLQEKDGLPFTAMVDGTSLVLIPVGEGNGFTLSMKALSTLQKSGITSLTLLMQSGMVELNTDFSLTGRVYGELRAKGYVSEDFVLSVSTEGLTVTVDGNRYHTDDSGLLTAYESSN